MRSRSSKWWILAASASAMFAQTTPPTSVKIEPAAVEGEVRNSVTGAPIERVLKASVDTGLFEWVGSLPMGFETLISAGGYNRFGVTTAGFPNRLWFTLPQFFWGRPKSGSRSPLWVIRSVSWRR